MELRQVLDNALALVGRSRSALVGSIGEGGYPNIKGMFRVENHDLNEFLFTTNTSSRRVAQFTEDGRACLYFVDFEKVEGLMLIGDMEVVGDPGVKARLWKDGWTRYYPLGPGDPDYAVLCFHAKQGSYYHSLEKTWFPISS